MSRFYSLSVIIESANLVIPLFYFPSICTFYCLVNLAWWVWAKVCVLDCMWTLLVYWADQVVFLDDILTKNTSPWYKINSLSVFNSKIPSPRMKNTESSVSSLISTWYICRYNGAEGLHTKVTEFVRDKDCLVCGPGILIQLDTSVTLKKVFFLYPWLCHIL